MKLLTIISILLATSLTPSAFSNEKVTFGSVGFAGNGCSEGIQSTGEALVKLTNSSLQIIPQEFLLSSKQSTRTLTRKKCDIALDVSVPDGYQIGISSSSSNAYLTLDQDSSATIDLTVGFPTAMHGNEELRFTEPTQQNVRLSNNAVQWSPCGADTIIRMKVAATLRTKQTLFSYLRINSFGLNLVTRPCQ